jgi:4-carboxymuconolactone decarboxylase
MRLPPIAPEDLKPEQKTLFDSIVKLTQSQSMGFVQALPNGALVGPFNPMLHFPHFGAAVWDVNVALSKHTTLPKPVHELVILLTGARFSSRYELYAHEVVAKTAGLKEAQIATLAVGNKPVDLSPEESLAFDMATALLKGAQLPDSTYRAGVAAFTEAGTAEIIFLVGFYCLISTLLNGYDAAVPGRAEIA